MGDKDLLLIVLVGPKLLKIVGTASVLNRKYCGKLAERRRIVGRTVDGTAE